MSQKTSQKTVRKNFDLSPGEDMALAKLLAAGYPFPANSEVAVIRKMLHDVWETVFPGKQFPSDQEAIQEVE